MKYYISRVYFFNKDDIMVAFFSYRIKARNKRIAKKKMKKWKSLSPITKFRSDAEDAVIVDTYISRPIELYC